MRTKLTFEDLMARLSRACEELSGLLGDEFIGLALFGSWARGEAGEESDVDVLVVLKSLKGMEARSVIYKTIAKHVKRALTLVDVRLNEIASDRVVLTPLLINIVADAIIIWDTGNVLRGVRGEGKGPDQEGWPRQV